MIRSLAIAAIRDEEGGNHEAPRGELGGSPAAADWTRDAGATAFR